MGSLLLVQACALGSSKVCPSSSPYCSLDAVIEGFTKLFVPHAHKRFQCPLTELKLGLFCCPVVLGLAKHRVDRKSTRLNSSHLVISYAVFCLKKKKKKH